MSYTFKCMACGAKIDCELNQIGSKVDCELCGSKPTVPLTTVVSGMVDGDLWIQKTVGTGNISETFVAKNSASGEKVFVKIYSRACVRSSEQFETLASSMYSWQNVDHPQILTVNGYGVIQEQFYTTTPYVEGKWLDELVAAKGPIPEKKALKIIAKVARLLRHGWQENGVLHGNVRPSNILVGKDGDVYLTDMGCDKMMLIPGPNAIGSVDFAGTVADYMSPEVARGETPTLPAVDIYSLGATLFFMLTGRQPYTASDSTQMIRRHLFEKPPDARSHGDVSDNAAKLVKQMMAKDVDQRIGTMREVSMQTKDILRNHTQVGETTDIRVGTTPNALPADEHVNTATGKTGLYAALAVVGVLAFALFAGILALVMRPDNTPSPHPAPPLSPPPSPSPPVAAPPNPKPESFMGTLRIVPDDACEVYVNGRYVGYSDKAKKPAIFRIRGLRPDKNVLAVRVRNKKDVGSLLAELTVDGKVHGTSDAWKMNTSEPPGWNTLDFNDSRWGKPKIHHRSQEAEWKQTAQMAPNTPARCIWATDRKYKGEIVFRYTFSCSSTQVVATTNCNVEGALLRLLGDDRCEAWLNGKRLGQTTRYNDIKEFPLTKLRAGKNVIGVSATNQVEEGSILAQVILNGRSVGTSSQWKINPKPAVQWASLDFDATGWEKATEHPSFLNDSGWRTPRKKILDKLPQGAPIWTANPKQTGNIAFRYEFEWPVSTGTSARPSSDNKLRVMAQDSCKVYLNGQLAGITQDATNVKTIRFQRVNPGKNVLAIEATNSTGKGWVRAELEIAGNKRFAGREWLISREASPTWNTLDFDDNAWEQAAVYFDGDSAKTCKNLGFTSGILRSMWFPDIERQGKAYLRYTFNGDGSPVTRKRAPADLIVVADDEVEVFLNGTKVGKVKGWVRVMHMPLIQLQRGRNVLGLHATNANGWGALRALLRVGNLRFASGPGWLANDTCEKGWGTPELDASGWAKAECTSFHDDWNKELGGTGIAQTQSKAIWRGDSVGERYFRCEFDWFPPAAQPQGAAKYIDIDTTMQGNVHISGSEVAIQAAGRDIWGVSDSFGFYHRAVKGDFRCRAVLTGMSKFSNWGRAGIMVREKLDKRSTHAMTLASNTRDVYAQGRWSLSQAQTEKYAMGNVGLPVVLEVERHGKQVTCAASRDGKRWYILDQRKVNWNDNAFVGLAVCSHNEKEQATATFKDVQWNAVPAPDEIYVPVPKDETPIVDRLVLVNTDTDKDVIDLQDGITLDLAKLNCPRFAFRVETLKKTERVEFILNGRCINTEENLPYTSAKSDGRNPINYHPSYVPSGKNHMKIVVSNEEKRSIKDYQFTIIGREEQVLKSVDFRNGLGQDVKTDGLSGPELVDGHAKFQTVSNGKIIVSGLNIPAADIDAVVCKMRVSKGGTELRLRFGMNGNAPKHSCPKQPGPIQNEWQEYGFYFHASRRFKGKLSCVRFDPTNQKDTTVEIESIRLVKFHVRK